MVHTLKPNLINIIQNQQEQHIVGQPKTNDK
jgi:hypothetical protein